MSVPLRGSRLPRLILLNSGHVTHPVSALTGEPPRPRVERRKTSGRVPAPAGVCCTSIINEPDRAVRRATEILYRSAGKSVGGGAGGHPATSWPTYAPMDGFA